MADGMLAPAWLHEAREPEEGPARLPWRKPVVRELSRVELAQLRHDPPPTPANDPGPGPAGDRAARGERLRTLTSTAFWTGRELPPAVPLLGAGIVSTSTRMFLVGPTGTGKTHLAMGLAAGMASGRGFLHWAGAGQKQVLYLDGEMPRATLQKRIRHLERRFAGADLSGIAWLSWQDAPDLAADFPELGEWAPLNTPKGRAFLLAYLDLIGGADVVILDNLMALTEGVLSAEEGWRATEPLVMALTARSTAQVWIDHMGHNEARTFGTSTKTWKFEAVGLMLKPSAEERAACPDARIAFTLTFDPMRGGKCRERDDDNADDFQTVAVRLTGDEWTATPADDPGAAGASRGKGDKPPLTTTQAGWWREIVDAFAQPGAAEHKPVPTSMPDAPGPAVPVMPRERLRDALADRGRLDRDDTGAVTQKSRNALSDMLKALEDKGKLGSTSKAVWLRCAAT